MSFRVLITGALLVSLVAMATGCFPLEEIFGHSDRWTQGITMRSRYNITLDFGKTNDIVMITEGFGAAKDKFHMRCLEHKGEGRYLMQVLHDFGDREIHYRCVKFTKLADYVVRISKTADRKRKSKANCEKDVYVQDPAVLIAYDDIETTPCPLTGGYQLIMDQGMAINDVCKGSVETYNPRIQFQCDQRDEGRAIADFGPMCKPPALAEAISLMKTRHMTHLRCVASWKEHQGSQSAYSTILMNVRDSPKSFWCLHYKKKPYDVEKATTYPGEEMFRAFLTMDGRCSGVAFVGGDVPRNSSMFGFLASYRPETDEKCTEKVYLKYCENRLDRCFDSTDCPSICHRCKKPFVTEQCTFDSDAEGKWSLVNSKRKMELTVKGDTLTSASFGTLMCRSQPEMSPISGPIIPVVQAGVATTCMPYYACVQAQSPASGILNFNLKPASRDRENGLPHSCIQVEEETKRAIQPVAEQTVTLLDTSKLKKVPCLFPNRMTFKTSSPCRLVVNQCMGDCNTLETTLDELTCGNETMWPYKIEKKHTCHARFSFEDGYFGFITSSKENERYVCWIVSQNQLLITSPELCNQEGVSRVMKEVDATMQYDPLSGLSLPLTGKMADGSATALSIQLVFVLAFCFLSFFVKL